jgi:hypothetical protein
VSGEVSVNVSRVGERAAIDVSGLPDHGFGSRSIMWWATVGVIAIEATVFVVTIAAYI